MKPPPNGAVVSKFKAGLQNTLLVVGAVAISLLITEWGFRQFVDDGQMYELEMWKYARDVKVRDMRPDTRSSTGST